MIFISIVGKSLSGKSSVRDMLHHHLSENNIEDRTLVFAEPFKEMIRKLFKLTVWHTDTQEGKASRPETCYGFSVRELMQKIGTDMFRNQIADSIWADTLVESAVAMEAERVSREHDSLVFLVPDMRELVEYNTLGEYPQYTIYLERDVAGSASNGHPSERMFDAPFNAVIPNQTMSISELRREIDSLFPEILSWITTHRRGDT